MVDLPFAHWSKLTPAVRAINMALWHALYGSVIGKRVADDELVRIGDSERKSGLYILGKPRMGKSWLIVNMILQDIENGHGVFFLDPHGDAIDDLLKRTTSGVLVFDHEDESYSFGINLLECANIDNVAARNDTFNKAKGVFDKLWKNTFEDKPWLQLVLQNTVHACKKELGTAGQAARQIILEFVNVCALLARPENHITKKSGQHTAKQVSVRTEADMSNEMVRNLTSLPKYTAYAKVLQTEGQNIWKGKIRTRELRATNDQGADTSETWRYIQARTRIREEIVERHDSLLDKSGGESRPPPASY